MTVQFYMDKPAIKQAAIDFRQALLDWKTKERIMKVAKIHRPEWTEEDLNRSVLYNEDLVNPILKALNPIIDLAIAGDIDEPFSMTSFTGSKVGRVLWDELSYPEITVPYEKFSELLRGGLTHDEFWKTDYYKLNLLPK